DGAGHTFFMTDESWKDGSGQFHIDTALIEKWFEIPADQAVEIELPRVSLDMLYVAIEKPYFALAALVRAMNAQRAGDQLEIDAAFVDLQAEVNNGLNSLKHFQTIIMATATNTPLDNNGRVIERGDSNGE
ncbi:hypothetical protein, partial [Sphingomonas sp. UBA4815]